MKTKTVAMMAAVAVVEVAVPEHHGGATPEPAKTIARPWNVAIHLTDPLTVAPVPTAIVGGAMPDLVRTIVPHRNVAIPQI